MIFRHICAASLLVLAACQPPAPEAAKAAEPAPAAEAPAQEASGCNVNVQKAWIEEEGARRYLAEASVIGPSCEQGVAVLVIRQREGTPLFTWSGLTSDLFGLSTVKEPADMKTALLDWIDQGEKPETTATLPAWEETEGQSKRAEFPFMPADGIRKAEWDLLRKENLEMFCFPQGMESSQCLVLRRGEDDAGPSIDEIGLQLFPG